MKAFVKTSYGGPEILRLEEVEMPVLKDDHILVKVLANSANPADWHILRGKPFVARFSFGLFKPKNKIPGADFAALSLKQERMLLSSNLEIVYLVNPYREEHSQNISLLRKLFVP